MHVDRVLPRFIVLCTAALLAGCSSERPEGTPPPPDSARVMAAAPPDAPAVAAGGAPPSAAAPSTAASGVAGGVPVQGRVPAGRGRSSTGSSTTAATHAPRRVVLGDLDLTGVGYDRGSPAAPVVMIDFSDFSCPYCGAFSRETYPAIEREYVATGKVFFKYVPFVAGGFPNSREATRAVECAADQGGFWRMMELVYEAQSAWRRARDPYPLLSGIGGVAGLDTARLGACFASRRTDARTARMNGVANEIGVRVTPSFVVDERPVQGALPLAEFRKVLDAALLVRGLGRE